MGAIKLKCVTIIKQVFSGSRLIPLQGARKMLTLIKNVFEDDRKGCQMKMDARWMQHEPWSLVG